MKTKLFIAIFIMAFLMINYKLPFKVNATSQNTISYAKGENLIDKNNLEFDGQEVKSINNIYLREPGETITFQLDSYFCNNTPIFCVEFFDVDFVSLGSETYNDIYNGFEIYNDIEWSVGHIDTCDYMDAFSFSFSCYPIIDVEIKDLEIMCFFGEELKEEYIPFVKANGLINIESEHPTIDISYKFPLSLNEIKELIQATDGYDGNISSAINISANEYLNTPTTKGKYAVVVTAVDSSLNEQNGYFYLNVVDNEFPTITGPSYIEYPINTEITSQMILINYSAYDDYDKDITSDLSIKTLFTNNSTEVKTEQIEIAVKDKSENEEVIQVELRFYDNIPPVITAPETIEYGYQLDVSIDKIINDNVSALDNVDGIDIETRVTSDGYSGNEHKNGEYIIEITSTDKSGNSSKKSIKIIVSDKIKPVIFINTYIIEVTESVSLKQIDFDNLLYVSGTIDESKKYDVIVLKDTYTGHECEKGSYLYSLKYIDESGFELTKTFKINVGFTSYKIDNSVQNSNKTNVNIIILSCIISVVSLAIMSTILLVKKYQKKSK